jgi:hypothetical protein
MRPMHIRFFGLAVTVAAVALSGSSSGADAIAIEAVKHDGPVDF